MTNDELFEIVMPIVEDFNDLENLKYDELVKINENLGVLIEHFETIETEVTDFRDVYNNNFDESAAAAFEESEENRELEFLEILVQQTAPIEIDDEIKFDTLADYSDLATLLILILIVLALTFSFLKYIYNSLTVHIR